MKTFQVIWNFVSTFFIIGGAAFGVAMAESGGKMPNAAAWALVIITATVAAMKETRSFIGLPPLSNGNYDALKQFVETTNKQKSDSAKPTDETKP